MLLSEQETRRICQQLLGFTRADDAAATVTSEDYAHARFAANSFATSGERHGATVQLTVWIEGKRGAASANQTDPATLRMVADEAERLARLSPIDVEHIPSLGPQKYREVRGYVAASGKTSPDYRAGIVNQAIAACEKARVIGAGFFSARGYSNGYATRNGNFSFERSSFAGLSVTARAADGGSSGYFLRSHFDVGKLDTARITREAVRKAIESAGPRPLPAGDYPVILEPQCVADLLGSFLAGAFDARSADEGRSAFSAPGGRTRLGEKVFDEKIRLSSDPWHPEVPGSQDVAGGIPAQRIDLVRDGVVESLVYSRFWAKEKGKEATPGPVNTLLTTAGKTASVNEMVQATERGLLLGRFWYIRLVDPRTILVTGLTRDGIWYIENGKIQYPVRNFRFNQSVIQMLAPGNVEMIGASERVGTSESGGRNVGFFPALKLRSFHFASQSEAI